MSTAQCGQTHGGVGREAGARRLRHRLQLLDEGRCLGQVTGEQKCERVHIEGQRQFAERAGAAGKLDVPVGKSMPAFVIPEVPGHVAG